MIELKEDYSKFKFEDALALAKTKNETVIWEFERSGANFIVTIEPTDDLDLIEYNFGLSLDKNHFEKNKVFEFNGHDQLPRYWREREHYIDILKGLHSYSNHLFFELVCNKVKKKLDYHQGYEALQCRFEDFKKLINDYPDLFFAYYKSPYQIEEEHHLGHWIYQENYRTRNWERIIKICNEACQKLYQCNWGEQKVERVEKIGKYIELTENFENDYKEHYINYSSWIAIKKITKFVKNRPLYIGDEEIGYIKNLVKLDIQYASHAEWDSDGDFYPAVPDYKSAGICIQLYPNGIKEEKFNIQEPDGHNNVFGKYKKYNVHLKDNEFYFIDIKLHQMDITETKVTLK